MNFRADEGAIVALFTTLALSAALLGSIALLLGRFAANEPGRWSIPVGIAAAAVQVIGYLLTATWTILIILALGRRLAGPWFSFLGYGAAALIAVGVFVPLDVPGTDFANFAGYILWSIWMLAFATLIWRRPARVAQQPAWALELQSRSAR